ncbi:MAG: PfkB family carbohydrate kinase [Planctomycetia bacterium]|nr:PfkB family carbohydrate kinase [Planctomycetia bacterium]
MNHTDISIPRILDALGKVMDRIGKGIGPQCPKIAVVGDFCLDKYLYRAPQFDELSVETGLWAHQIDAIRSYAGVGGTISANLASLGAEVFCCGIVGYDGEAWDLLAQLRNLGAHDEYMIQSSSVLTNTYMKPMRKDQKDSDWVEENRMDLRNRGSVPEELTDKLIEKTRIVLDQTDAVIITDQFLENSGSMISDRFRDFLSEEAKKRSDLFFLCDSRFYIDRYRNMMIKCNANEMLEAYHKETINQKIRTAEQDRAAGEKQEDLLEAGRSFVRRNNAPVLITRGEKGSLLLQSEGSDSIRTSEIPSRKVDPPIDVCGAGDATNAGLAFAHSLGLSLADSAFFAGIVSSITIKQIGITGTANLPEIIHILKDRI